MNDPMAAMFGTSINFSTPRDLYPDAAGATTAGIGGAATPYTTDASAAPVADGGSSVAVPAGRTIAGQPIVWFVVLIVLFLALGWAGHKLGGREGETGVHNLRLSGYNVLFITLAAMIGFGVMKVLFSKLRVPGLSTYVQSV